MGAVPKKRDQEPGSFKIRRKPRLATGSEVIEKLPFVAVDEETLLRRIMEADRQNPASLEDAGIFRIDNIPLRFYKLKYGFTGCSRG